MKASPAETHALALGTTGTSATRLAGADVLHRRNLGSAADRDRMEVDAHRLRIRVVRRDCSGA